MQMTVVVAWASVATLLNNQLVEKTNTKTNQWPFMTCTSKENFSFMCSVCVYADGKIDITCTVSFP